MAKVLLNICLDVEASNVVVTPAGEGSSPTEPPYWFEAYWSQNDDPTPVKGDTFTLPSTGECRLFVYDDEPTTAPSLSGPGSQDTSVKVSFEGRVSLISCATNDPWPKT